MVPTSCHGILGNMHLQESVIMASWRVSCPPTHCISPESNRGVIFSTCRETETPQHTMCHTTKVQKHWDETLFSLSNPPAEPSGFLYKLQDLSWIYSWNIEPRRSFVCIHSEISTDFVFCIVHYISVLLQHYSQDARLSLFFIIWYCVCSSVSSLLFCCTVSSLLFSQVVWIPWELTSSSTMVC